MTDCHECGHNLADAPTAIPDGQYYKLHTYMYVSDRTMHVYIWR